MENWLEAEGKGNVYLLLIPVPLMMINAGQNTMAFPFLGTLDIGLLYPLLIIPLGMIGTSNAFNMLAGYNGLEAGMGVVIHSGSLAMRDKVYSIPHIAILFLRKIKGRAYEYEVVLVVLLLQGVIAMYTLYSFYAP